jgi:ribosomal protein L18E
MLEERRNTALVNVRKYQESLKKYYNKIVVQRELNIGDLVLKKTISALEISTSFCHPRNACSS